MIIAIDFDGTIVDHQYPDIGDEVPGAIETIKALALAGHQLILYTMRSDKPEAKEFTLTAAIEFCQWRGVIFNAVNVNPQQKEWTASPKVYAQIYIDDAALGCPIRENPRMGGRPYVDWHAVGRLLRKRGALP
jgi:hypothetical protein